MKTVLDVLDDFVERHSGNVLISRRFDLTAPDEWSAIITCAMGEEQAQFGGYGMSAALAIERALERAGIFPCLTCKWEASCDHCRGVTTKGGTSARTV